MFYLNQVNVFQVSCNIQKHIAVLTKTKERLGFSILNPNNFLYCINISGGSIKISIWPPKSGKPSYLKVIEVF